MLQRTTIGSLPTQIGKTVTLAGFVQAIRDQSKIVFLVIRDRSGTAQVVVHGNPELITIAQSLTTESVVIVTGTVVESKQATSGIELQAATIEIVSLADPILPIPVVTQKGGGEAEQPLRLDYRWIDLRRPEHLRIFQVWNSLERGARQYWEKEQYMQIYTPSFMSTPSETGAEVFKVDYFDRTAYLAQSPQFYKQMALASGFERVFMTGPVFRAEASFTSRHLTEFTGWDFELAFIDSHHDIMDEEEKLLVSAFTQVKTDLPDVNIDIPAIPFPRITILEAKKMLQEAGVVSDEDHDLSPEEEREMSRLVKEKYNHDFVFITEYHKSKSAFYHMRTEHDADRGRRADLLYRGVEVTTLAQREHRIDILEKQAIEKGMSLEALKDYLNFFRWGCPPHGGAGIGPARLVMKIMELPNVREATYLPRDVKRVGP